MSRLTMKRRADKTGKQRAQTFRGGEIRIVKPGTFDYQTDGCAFRKGRVLFLRSGTPRTCLTGKSVLQWNKSKRGGGDV